MSGNGIDLGIVVFYALGALAYGLWVSRRVRTSLDYTVAGRQLGLFALVGTLVMTELNPSTMIWFGSISYSAGPRAAWLCLIFIVGLGSYGLLVARRWQRLRAVSIAEMFEARYSLGMRRAVSLCTTLILTLFSSGYLIATSKTFSSALGLSPSGALVPGWITADRTLVWTALVISTTVLIFTWAGGLISVAFTDTASLIVTVVVLPLLAISALQYASPEPLLHSYQAVDPDPVLPLHFIVTLNVVILLCYPLAPWYGQRMFAARNEKVALAAVGIATLATTLLYACGQVATILYHGHQPDLPDPDQAVGGAMNLFLGPGVRGLMLAMLFAVCQTTMSSIWNTTSAMVVQDFYKGWLRPQATDADQLRVGRKITLVLGVITLLLCMTLLGKLLVVINLFGNTLFAAMFFPCVFGFLWWKASRRASIVCLLLGWVLGVGIAVYANILAEPVVPYPVWARWIYVYLMPAICLLGVLVSYLDRPSPEEIRRRVAFFQRVGAPWVGARDFRSQAQRSNSES